MKVNPIKETVAGIPTRCMYMYIHKYMTDSNFEK